MRKDITWREYLNALPLADEDVVAAEEISGVKLPEDFIRLMRAHQGMSASPMVVSLNGEHLAFGHLSFLGNDKNGESKYGLISWLETYRRNGYPEHFVPFARSGGSAHFALDYHAGGPTVSYVYLDSESPETGYWGFVHVADSVSDMLDMLVLE